MKETVKETKIHTQNEVFVTQIHVDDGIFLNLLQPKNNNDK